MLSKLFQKRKKITFQLYLHQNLLIIPLLKILPFYQQLKRNKNDKKSTELSIVIIHSIKIIFSYTKKKKKEKRNTERKEEKHIC